MIRTIISVLDVKPAYPNHFKYTVVPIKDAPTEDIVAASAHAVEVIAESLRNGQNVLVHCHCGISRSVCVVIIYLMKHRGMTYQSALDFVQSKRSMADPNEGFRVQMARLETSIKHPGGVY